jgi:hypothetical protein
MAVFVENIKVVVPAPPRGRGQGLVQVNVASGKKRPF